MAESSELLRILFYGFVAISRLSSFVQGDAVRCQVGSLALETGQPIKTADTTIEATVFILENVIISKD